MLQRHDNHMKTWVSLLTAACVLNAQAASYLGPEVGDVAPPLKVKKWLQAPSQATAGWPAGKVVILEFWATWCGPCLGAIPHLNELAEQFKDKPVQFIAVTDEKENVIQPFLMKTPITAWIGLSADAIFGEANPYRVYAIPHTVIINANGRVAGTMDPWALTPNLIELCLAGKPLPQVGEQGVTSVQNGLMEIPDDLGSCPAVGVVPGQSQIGRTPMFQIMIRPVSTNRPSPNSNPSAQKQQAQISRSSRSDLGLSMPNGQLKNAIMMVFNTKPTRMALEAELPKEPYDFYVSLPPRNLGLNARMLETVFSQAIQATFGLSIKRESRTVDVFVLRTNATSLEKLAKSTCDGKKERYGLNELVGVNRSIGSLAEGLENDVGQPVLDESGVTNLYSFHLKWDQQDFKHPNPEGMTKAVNNLGLELEREKRLLDLVVVRTAS
jgi:uncharacterized protein (TIGR03435 family)